MPKPDGMSRNKWKRLKVQVRLGNQEMPESKPVAVSTDAPEMPVGPMGEITSETPTVTDSKAEGDKKCSTCGNEGKEGNIKQCHDCFNCSLWVPKATEQGTSPSK